MTNLQALCCTWLPVYTSVWNILPDQVLAENAWDSWAGLCHRKPWGRHAWTPRDCLVFASQNVYWYNGSIFQSKGRIYKEQSGLKRMEARTPVIPDNVGDLGKTIFSGSCKRARQMSESKSTEKPSLGSPEDKPPRHVFSESSSHDEIQARSSIWGKRSGLRTFTFNRMKN